MRRYLRIYRSFIQTSLAYSVAYPGNFFSALFSSLMFTAFHIISILLLTSYAPIVYGWTRNELIMLTLVFNVIRSLISIFFIGGLNRMSDTIFKGELDGLLLKPINSQFLTSFRVMEFHSIVRAAIVLVVLVWFMLENNINVNIYTIFGFVVFSFFGLILLYSIWFMAMTLLIWNPVLTNIRELLLYITGLLRYPTELYKELGSLLFAALLPLIIIAVTPTKMLLGNATYQDTIFMGMVAVAGVYASHLFWQFALRHYTSASS